MNKLSASIISTDRRPRVGVGVVVERNDGKILLGKRLNTHGEGEWSVPGGHIEYGEGILECARRELTEETGLTANLVEYVTVTNNLLGLERKHYFTFFVFARKLAGSVQLLEPEKCEGWQWFGWDELPTPLFPTVASFLDQHQRGKFEAVLIPN